MPPLRQAMEPVLRPPQPDDAMTIQTDRRPAAIRAVLPFVFRHWLQQPLAALTVLAGLLGATVADLFMPVFLAA